MWSLMVVGTELGLQAKSAKIK